MGSWFNKFIATSLTFSSPFRYLFSETMLHPSLVINSSMDVFQMVTITQKSFMAYSIVIISSMDYHSHSSLVYQMQNFLQIMIPVSQSYYGVPSTGARCKEEEQANRQRDLRGGQASDHGREIGRCPG